MQVRFLRMPAYERVTHPSRLVAAVARQNLIPFVGAGLSALIGLPRWDDLLRRVADKLPSDIPFSDLKIMCGNDPMKVAEYLYQQAGREIGPLRHRISEELGRGSDPALSSAHVELVNLGARRIYTTNYDDALERTFASLGEDSTTIALPRHIAQASSSGVEIVKYHGDLQWEKTLVLTESSYYSRLQFETPLDIKFRSDLLGNSVIFLGYGFGDMNIRVIWHRLVDMMRGVDPEERPRSFILRLDRNPALETLDKAADITTITDADDSVSHGERIARSLMTLLLAASPNGLIPGSTKPMFMSPYFVSTIRHVLKADSRQEAESRARPFSVEGLVDQVASRRIPNSLREEIEALIDDCKSSTLSLANDVLTAVTPNLSAHLSITDGGAGKPSSNPEDRP